MRMLLTLLLTATMPLAGVAQTLAPVTSFQPPAASARPVIDDNSAVPADFHAVPLWGTPDGRILAMISAGSAAYPTLPKSPQIGAPSEWRLIDVTNAVSADLLANLGDRSSANVSISGANLIAPALNAQCAGTDTSCATNALARTGALRVGLDWLANDNLDIDLSYGLSWLHRNDSLPADRPMPVYDTFVGVGSPLLPSLIVPGYDLANATSASVSGLGRLRVNDGNQVLDFGASLSRIQLSLPGSAPLTSLNQAAVSFGLEYGSFAGVATAHVIGPTDTLGPSSGNPRLTGLDVGFSWRTPWRGMFSFGAQNLWSTGSLPLAAPINHDADPNQARVPYVQYHQDL